MFIRKTKKMPKTNVLDIEISQNSLILRVGQRINRVAFKLT